MPVSSCGLELNDEVSSCHRIDMQVMNHCISSMAMRKVWAMYIPLGQINRPWPLFGNKIFVHHRKKLARGLESELSPNVQTILPATPPHNDMVDFNGIKTFLFFT